MTTNSKAGWGLPEWTAAVGVSRSYAYELLASGRLPSVKLGARRIITQSPADFLAEIAAAAEPSSGRPVRSPEPGQYPGSCPAEPEAA